MRWFKAFVLQKTRGPSLRMLIPFQLATPVLTHLSLGFVMTQQFFTGTLEKGHSDRGIKTAVWDDNSHDVTPYYLPKQQPLSNHFPNNFRTSGNVDRYCGYLSRAWFLNWPPWLCTCDLKYEYGCRATLTTCYRGVGAIRIFKRSMINTTHKFVV